jgi:hypothetical protein
VNDNAGHNINLLAPITTTATIPLVNVVTNYKIFGGRFGGSIAFPFMKNGPEEAAPWRGTAGYFEGSYFTGMEGSLRTPALIRYPGHVPAGQRSNEIIHITQRPRN